MLGRTRGYGGAYWRRALAASFALHGLALLTVGLGLGIARRDRATADRNAGFVAFPVLEMPTIVDLTAFDTVAAPDLLPRLMSDPPPPDDPPIGRQADQANKAPVFALHPAQQGSPRARPPAPDQGTGAGRVLEDAAFRRDTSSLHERLADGADSNQPSRARTGDRAASPQAVRREPITGAGDSTRTSHRRDAVPPPSYGIVQLNEPGAGAETNERPTATTVAVVAASVVHPVDQAPVVETAQGPLDVDRGTRSFDVSAAGPTPVDDRPQREASTEARPSITDLSLSASPGRTNESQGPSDAPGAVARRAPGSAPAPRGVTGGVSAPPAGSSEADRTQERVYDRYKQQIRDRVDRLLVFPRALAVRLEQGETILRFVVRPDGQLGDTIQIVKSSGFQEFDQAALDAVRRASPFPPMPDASHARPLPVAQRVTFSNPVIR